VGRGGSVEGFGAFRPEGRRFLGQVLNSQSAWPV